MLLCRADGAYDRDKQTGATMRKLIRCGFVGEIELLANTGPPKAAEPPIFVVGVTGHRDIFEDEKDVLRECLRKNLSLIKGYFDHASVQLVCGMAEGADTLAAEVALDMGIGVVAVLPMPQKLYEADFDSAAANHLRELLAHPEISVLEMPLPAGREESDLEDQDARDDQYKLLADYIVRRSNVLVAIWDGVAAAMPGGTSDVAFRYLSDSSDHTPNFIKQDGGEAEDCGNLLFWLPARRQSAPDRELPQGDLCLISNANYDYYWQQNKIPEQFVIRWKGFDAYAADWKSDLGADLAAYGLAQGGIDALTFDLKWIEQEFIRADQMARAYQGRSDKMFALFGLLAGAMGLAFLVYAKLLAVNVFLYAYIALFVVGFIGFRYSARRHLHSGHLAYRTLAETFRVQFFLILSGAGESYSLKRILGLTSVNRFARFEWLQEGVRCAEPLVYFGHYAKGDALQLVRDHWIADQAAYFGKKLHSLHAQHYRLEVIKTALLTGSVIGALSLIFFKKTLLHLDMMGYDGKAWLVFFMGLLPLWVAVWELYQGKMATRELLWQYSNQRRFFRSAEREIAQVADLRDAKKIIRDLADKALIEIYLWSVHRYHREHEPPAAG